MSYPSGIGTVPSPGSYDWAAARAFDEGGLGVRVSNGNLIVRTAGGLNPQTGYWSSSWGQYYGLGDVFLTVDDSTGVKNFALLNSWARDPGTGAVRSIDGPWFNDAQSFHVGGGFGGQSLEGHLVLLSSISDVALTGTPTGAPPSPPGDYPAWQPSGMDSRIYAQGGTDFVNALLTHSTTTDEGLNGVLNQTFYLQTWTVPLNLLSNDLMFDIGLHQATSCGNDQIGMVATVPVPGAVVLGMLGFGVAGWRLKRETS